jgi:hypothetical protein
MPGGPYIVVGMRAFAAILGIHTEFGTPLVSATSFWTIADAERIPVR